LARNIEEEKEDAILVGEIRKAYEDEYGVINRGHTQEPVVAKEAPATMSGAEWIEKQEGIVERSLSETEKSERIQDGQKQAVPEQELSRLQKEEESLVKDGRIFKDTEELKSSEIESTKIEKKPVSTLSTPKPSKIAKYTILAYDAKTKDMTTATFESIPSESEKAIQTTVALRHLTYANRFLPKLIELQHRGFVPVHAERNLLIL
jgi:hypothetical protein